MKKNTIFDDFEYYTVDQTKKIWGMTTYKKVGAENINDIILNIPNLIGSVVEVGDQYYEIIHFDKDESSFKYKIFIYKVKNITRQYKNKDNFLKSLK